MTDSPRERDVIVRVETRNTGTATGNTASPHTHHLPHTLTISLTHSPSPSHTHHLPHTLTISLTHSPSPSHTHHLPHTLTISLTHSSISLTHSPTHSPSLSLSLSLLFPGITIGWIQTTLTVAEDAGSGEIMPQICFRVLSTPDNRQATITVVARPVEGTATGECVCE